MTLYECVLLLPMFIALAAADDVPKNKIKVPVPVNVSGKALCNYMGAYAVLVNIVEEVSCLFVCLFFLSFLKILIH